MVRSPASDPEHAPRRGRCYKKTIAMVLRRKPISNLKFYMSTRLEQLGTKDERTNSVMDDPTWPCLAGQGRLVLRLAVVRDLSRKRPILQFCGPKEATDQISFSGVLHYCEF